VQDRLALNGFEGIVGSMQVRLRERQTVLLVSATADDSEMYAEYLRQNQVEAIEANNTTDALRLADGADVIVTGIRIPGPFDGLELIRRLRATGRTARKPVIVLTACAFDTDKQRARRAGCDRFLVKPYPPEDLLLEVRRLARPPSLTARARTKAG
jgi:CheY-like chemotaxis protein